MVPLVVAVLVFGVWVLWSLNSEDHKQVATALEYVRANVAADYPALREVVAEDARVYVDAMASVPQPEAPPFSIADTTWEGSTSVTVEIAFSVGSTFLRLSREKDAPAGEIAVESWNDAGDTSSGSMTIADEGGRWVVAEVDGEPIDEVLSRGTGLW